MQVVSMLRDHVLLIWIVCVAELLRNVAAGEVPVFVQEPESVVAKLKSPVKLHCKVQPETAEVKWILNNLPISTDTERGIEIEDNGRTLHILSFKHTKTHQPHVGRYQCVATTSVGSIVSRMATLERAYLASFKRMNGSVMNVDVLAGNTANLPCPIPRAVPSAVTVFEVNSTSIYTNSARHKLLQDGSLQIGNVQPSDQGLYKCIAINSISHHKRSAKTRINLRVIASTEPRKPYSVVQTRKNTEVVLGKNITLPCVFHGYPTPEITWEHYGGRLSEHSHQELGNLIIAKVTEADNGVYLCRGENDAGEVQAQIYNVDVLVPPKVTTPLSQQTILVGGKATFVCVTRGSPRVSQMWLHNGEPVTADRHMEITNTTLTINNAQSVHEGMYQCMATNRVGQTHSDARLVVKNASSMDGNGTIDEALLTPSLPRVEQVTKTSVQVRWTLHPGPAVRMFVVQYKLPKEKWQTAGDVDGSERDFTIQGLKPRNKYAFRVQVKYEDGAARSSEKSTLRLVKNVSHLIRELQDGTPGTGDLVSPPSIIHSPSNVDALSNTTALLHCSGQGLALSWLCDGVPINMTANARFRVLDNGTLEISRTKLKDVGMYTCAVTNDYEVYANASAFLSVQELSTASDEGRADGVASNTTSLTGLPSTTEVESVEMPAKGGRGHGGKKGRKKNKNKKGKNNKNKKPRVENTGSGNMVPPNKPTVDQTSESSALLEWSMSRDTMKVEFFKVQYREKILNKRMSTWKTIDEELAVGTFKYEVTGLNPGGKYKFRIAAMFVNNQFKMSDVSATLKLATSEKQKAPSLAPRITHVVSINDNSIKIYWQYDINVKFRIDGYFIEYRKFTQTKKLEWQNGEVLGRLQKNFLVSGLEPLTMYEIRVQIFNNINKGPFSNIVVKETLALGSTASPDKYPAYVPSGKSSRNDGDNEMPTLETSTDDSSLLNKSGSHNSSTSRSNEMLYIFLGVALGLMILFLVIFMVLCWRKQRQQNKMMADMDAKYRNKFQDPAQQIYNSQLGAKKHGNGFLLNGINGHSNHNGRPDSPYVSGKMNINVNPLTDVENQELTGEDSDATKLAESSPDLPNGHARTSPSNDSIERQRNRQNLQNILDTDDIAPIDYSNFMGTSGSIQSNQEEVRPQFTTFIGSQGHLARPELANGSANGSLRHQNRSYDQHTANEQSQAAQAKHKRRKKRPTAQSHDQMRDQATNTDISSNEGTLENDMNLRSLHTPAPLNQNSRYVNSYECDD